MEAHSPADPIVDREDRDGPGGLSVGTWRAIAVFGCGFAVFWPLLQNTFLAAGNDALMAITEPYPSRWVAAFMLGALLAKLDALWIALSGAVAAMIVGFALHDELTSIPVEAQFSWAGNAVGPSSPDLLTVLAELGLPWLAIATLIGLGAIFGERWGRQVGILPAP